MVNKLTGGGTPKTLWKGGPRRDLRGGDLPWV